VVKPAGKQRGPEGQILGWSSEVALLDYAKDCMVDSSHTC
jgi:hypothetical protein